MFKGTFAIVIALMGVEAIEMDWEDGKLQNNIKLMSIEKSLEKLSTSQQRIWTASILEIYECSMRIW